METSLLRSRLLIFTCNSEYKKQLNVPDQFVVAINVPKGIWPCHCICSTLECWLQRTNGNTCRVNPLHGLPHPSSLHANPLGLQPSPGTFRSNIPVEAYKASQRLVQWGVSEVGISASQWNIILPANKHIQLLTTVESGVIVNRM